MLSALTLHFPLLGRKSTRKPLKKFVNYYIGLARVAVPSHGIEPQMNSIVENTENSRNQTREICKASPETDKRLYKL